MNSLNIKKIKDEYMADLAKAENLGISVSEYRSGEYGILWRWFGYRKGRLA